MHIEKDTHNLKLLMESAGLDVTLKQDMKHDPELEVNWNAVIAWSESSRYEKYNDKQAQDLHFAVNDPNHGALNLTSISLSLSDISLLSPDNNLVNAIKTTVRRSKDVTLKGTVTNGILVNDAYIYCVA